MSTLITRAGKGTPLTNTEVDTNFTNLNSDKYQAGDNASFGSLTHTGSLIAGLDASVTAAGTTQGDATAVTKTYNIVTTASANQGVKLPTAATGVRVTVYNSTSALIKIYPNTSDAIDDGSANAPITLRPNKVKEYIAISVSQWNTVIDDLEDLDVSTIAATVVTTTGDVNLGAYLNHSVTATVSSAGSSQGDATALSSGVNVITTVSANTTGIKLPTAVAGRTLTIINTTTTDCKLYPNTSDTIEGGSANVHIVLPAKTSKTMSARNATDWRQHRDLAVYNSSGTLLN
tara:strand:+ start:11880 stop:12746 length:867 start_codon:yes stop_codon:yes gene_type:complete